MDAIKFVATDLLEAGYMELNYTIYTQNDQINGNKVVNVGSKTTTCHFNKQMY